ncbi:MAG: hypothetical protein ACRC7O_06000, partial [Fimbriiglobus sp.]
ARQLGLGVHHYAEAFSGTLPPVKTRDNGLDRWWFGTLDPAAAPGTAADPAGGHLMPYLENNQAMFAGPARTPGKVSLRYGGGTGGYGYNYRTLAPFTDPGSPAPVVWTRVKLSGIAHTAGTVAFTNSVATTADVGPDGASPSLVETPSAEPPSAQFPTVHFRLAGKVATVLFLDGHVEARTDRTRNPPPIGEDPAVTALRDRENVFDIGTTDELWDRE